MPRIILGTTKVRIKTSKAALAKRIANKAAPGLIRNIEKNQELILNKAIEIFVNAFVESPIIKGLGGAYSGNVSGRDLQAEFGLTQSLAEEAVSDMINILSGTFRVSVGKGRARQSDGTLLLTAKIEGLNQKEYISKFLQMPTATYSSTSETTSKRGGKFIKDTEIPWMDWLLNAEERIDGFGITFDIGDSANSRSGRALMTTNEEAASRFPWSVPRYVLPQRGETFVEDVVLTKSFQNLFASKMKQAFKTAVR